MWILHTDPCLVTCMPFFIILLLIKFNFMGGWNLGYLSPLCVESLVLLNTFFVLFLWLLLALYTWQPLFAVQWSITNQEWSDGCGIRMCLYTIGDAPLPYNTHSHSNEYLPEFELEVTTSSPSHQRWSELPFAKKITTVDQYMYVILLIFIIIVLSSANRQACTPDLGYVKLFHNNKQQ